ncbi:MAG: hypothetical protein HQK93_06635, partial [Nitrospirae bacterium]|nr:hypothetical protein [Nitrospirota bacterium]
TEGPLYESLEATFQRIDAAFGLRYAPSFEQLNRLKKGLDIPENLRDIVMEFISDDRLNYNKTWAHVDNMLDEMMSEEWRNSLKDDFGSGYIFNWFILDHIGYDINPRRRALGYHVIYDHYRDKLKEFNQVKDRLYWHYHPLSFFNEAHKTSNNFSYSNNHIQIINRRIIDQMDFPVAYRPGCHVERPDINLFLELWIPLDYGNQGCIESVKDKNQQDISGGRYGDWRRATDQWEVYHPDFYDYQKKGQMKRYIARCLNLNSRLREITKEEIEKAFIRANVYNPTILSVTNHDEREMRPYIKWFMDNIREIQKLYPEVKIMHTNAVDAIRFSLKMKPISAASLHFKWTNNRLDIYSDKEIWGTQPWFCFKTKDKRYIHENLDFHDNNYWSYIFDEDTITLDRIESIGIAANDAYFNTSVYKLFPEKDLERTDSKYLNILSEL